MDFYFGASCFSTALWATLLSLCELLIWNYSPHNALETLNQKKCEHLFGKKSIFQIFRFPWGFPWSNNGDCFCFGFLIHIKNWTLIKFEFQACITVLKFALIGQKMVFFLDSHRVYLFFSAVVKGFNGKKCEVKPCSWKRYLHIYWRTRFVVGYVSDSVLCCIKSMYPWTVSCRWSSFTMSCVMTQIASQCEWPGLVLLFTLAPRLLPLYWHSITCACNVYVSDLAVCCSLR